MCQMPVLGAAEPLACSTLLEECVAPLWLNALEALAGWHVLLKPTDPCKLILGRFPNKEAEAFRRVCFFFLPCAP